MEGKAGWGSLWARDTQNRTDERRGAVKMPRKSQKTNIKCRRQCQRTRRSWAMSPSRLAPPSAQLLCPSVLLMPVFRTFQLSFQLHLTPQFQRFRRERSRLALLGSPADQLTEAGEGVYAMTLEFSLDCF